jgi:hypothetical protein
MYVVYLGKLIWTVGCHLCQPLEKFGTPRYVVEIDGELVVIDGVVDVSRCDGCI